MYVDYKVTNWERIFIPEEIKDNVIDLMKAGKLKSSEDLWSLLGDYHIEMLEETEEELDVKSNGGECTLEVFDSDTTSIYNNKDLKYKKSDFKIIKT